MKTIITILIMLMALTACGNDTTTKEYSTTGTTQTEPTPAPSSNKDPTADTKPTANTVFTPLYIMQIENDAYRCNTSECELFGTGQLDKAASNLFVLDNQLFSFDDTGPPITLDHVPTQSRSTEDGLYTCIELTPEESQAQGAQPKYHTEFFLDGSSLGHWVFNQMRCIDIIHAGGSTFAVKETGALKQIGGDEKTALYVLENEFVMHSLDEINTRIDFNDRTEDFTMNHLTSSKQWLKYADQYYSEKGYVWDPVEGLQELVTAMQDFNTAPYPIELPYGQTPTLLSIGVRDESIYWIEANTGWLIAYDPELDEINIPIRLYTGDGLHSTGVNYRDTLKPVIIEQYIYYTHDGILKRLDLDTGFFDEIYAGTVTIFLID
jgi:hypothetical protein